VAYRYPVDVDDLVSRVKRRGREVVDFVGLKDEMRDDLKLTQIAWGVSLGWFPVRHDGAWHGALDIGLPNWGGESYAGTPVYAIGDGEVVYLEERLVCAEGYDFGRVIVKHSTPDRQDFYALYKHLVDLEVSAGQSVSAGALLGKIGNYGGFPHLSFAVAALAPLGGQDDLIPECPWNALPAGEGVFNLLRIRMDTLDPVEWPVSSIQNTPAYLFNPVEVVRYCRGERYEHDFGRGSCHGVLAGQACEGLGIVASTRNEVRVNPLRSRDLKDDARLVSLAQSPSGQPIAKGYSNKDTAKAIQRALKTCQYNVGRFGPDHDGIDGDFGATTEKILADFQKNKLKGLFETQSGKDLLSKFGKSSTNLRTDGVLDWLTLIGLDMVASAHEGAPPAPTPPVVPVASAAKASASASEKEISLDDAKVLLLKCTAVFEGAWDSGKKDFNFGVLAPNFDLAGLSIGLIQWNIKSRNVFPLLKKMHACKPDKFKECYEGGNAECFRAYFAKDWPATAPKDVWKFSEFQAFMSSGNLDHHYQWVKLLHKSEAIQTVTDEPKWRTKDKFHYADKALQPELIAFFKRLGEVKEFQEIQIAEAWAEYGTMAKSDIRWLRSACGKKYADLMKKIELRTLAAIFDLNVQQGGFGLPTRDSCKRIKANLADASNYTTQKQIVEMAVTVRAAAAPKQWQNNCASRRLGFLNAQVTKSSSLQGDDRPVQNCNFELLKENPYVQDV
jgi:hypothetical protein